MCTRDHIAAGRFNYIIYTKMSVKVEGSEVPEIKSGTTHERVTVLPRGFDVAACSTIHKVACYARLGSQYTKTTHQHDRLLVCKVSNDHSVVLHTKT